MRFIGEIYVFLIIFHTALKVYSKSFRENLDSVDNFSRLFKQVMIFFASLGLGLLFGNFLNYIIKNWAAGAGGAQGKILFMRVFDKNAP